MEPFKTPRAHNAPVLFVIIALLLGLNGLLIYKMNKMESSFSRQIDDAAKNATSQRTVSFKKLQDSLSAKSGVTVMQQPGITDKLFNTKLNQAYKNIMAGIPAILREELKRMPKGNPVTEITKAQIVVSGDTVKYLNKEGVTTKTARVYALTGDSSLLVIVPQKIEITGVRTERKTDGKINYLLNALNTTTGETMEVAYSEVLQIEQPSGRLKFKLRPELSVGYNTIRHTVYETGLKTLTYENKHFNAQLFTMRLGTNLRETWGQVDFVRVSL